MAPSRDPRITAYIKDSEPFARPILEHIRKLVHATCPDAQETLKWGMPHFMYRDAILCGMASFKAHCTFHFWHGDLVVEAKDRKRESAMGQFGRLTGVADLPPKARLVSYIRQAMKLNESGAKTRRPLKHKKPPLRAPADFLRAVRADARALATYEALAPSRKREYVEWVSSAKAEETRERRLETAVEWMAAGRSMNWKYERKR